MRWLLIALVLLSGCRCLTDTCTCHADGSVTVYMATTNGRGDELVECVRACQRAGMGPVD
jgi:hypothetical protein